MQEQNLVDIQMESNKWVIAAEMGILSGLLDFSARGKGDFFEDVLNIYGPEMWFCPDCKIVARAMQNMIYAGEKIDAISLARNLLSQKCNLSKGPTLFIAELIESSTMISSVNLKRSAQILFEDYLKRLTTASLSQALQISENPHYPKESMCQILKDCLETLETESILPVEETAQHVKEYFSLIESGGTPLISTPWSKLNYALAGGISPGELVVIGARPSVGKTALAANWFWHVSACGGNALFFSLEMSRNELFNRIVAKLAGINSREFRGKLTDDKLSLVADACDRILSADMYIDDRGLMTTSEIKRICRVRSKNKPLSLVVIDYLQLVTPTGKNGNREQEVSSISRELKLIAKEFEVPILLLSQLNRKSESENREPQMSDLRESGAIEQDADTIIFLHQDKITIQSLGSGRPEPLKVIVRKGRNTGTAVARLIYNKQIQNIYDQDSKYDDFVQERFENGL